MKVLWRSLGMYIERAGSAVPPPYLVQCNWVCPSGHMKFSWLRAAKSVSNVKLYRGQLVKDHLKLHVKGGAGGSGLAKNTGCGGAGGDVYLKSRPGVSLSDVERMAFQRDNKLVAGNGTAPSRLVAVGSRGRDLVIPVPLGISVYDHSQTKVLAELNAPAQTVLVAKGGEGGRPETRFRPDKGESVVVRLDLKLIADVGLVGFPNAGKSTFLRAISRAKPKVASYPFTTLRPHLGTITFDDYRAMTVADLPGLIEGAAQNVGLGHEFLKHVQRTKLLLFVVDVHGFRLNPQAVHRSAWHTILLLNKELEEYDESLLSKPCLLCINKMDLPNAEAKADQLQLLLDNYQRWSHCRCHLAAEVYVDNSQREEDVFRPRVPLQFAEVHRISAHRPATVAHIGHRLRHVIDDARNSRTAQLFTGRDRTRIRLPGNH